MILSQIRYINLIKDDLNNKYQFYLKLIKKFNIKCKVFQNKKNVYPYLP